MRLHCGIAALACAVLFPLVGAESKRAEAEEAAAAKEAALDVKTRKVKVKKSRDVQAASGDSSESEGAPTNCDDPERPNFFLCFRCNAPEIREAAAKMQQHAICVDHNLIDACIPIDGECC